MKWIFTDEVQEKYGIVKGRTRRRTIRERGVVVVGGGGWGWWEGGGGILAA